MRILYLQNMFGQGGINKNTSIKENYLVAHGYEVHHLNVYEDGGVPKELLYSDKIHFHAISGTTVQKLVGIPVIGKLLRFLYYRIMLLWQILKIRPNLIVATMPYLEPLSVLLLTCSIKRVLEFQGWYVLTNKITGKNKWRARLEFPFYQMVCITEGESKHMFELTGRRSLHIPNVSYTATHRYSDCSNRRVLTMARLAPQKNFPGFLPAWKKVQKKHPDWQLDIFGDGPDKAALERIISAQGLTTVHLHPFTLHPEEEYLKASIYILPSMFEGWGLVLGEAMSFGVPCVSYDCPYGPSEIIRNGEDGLITKYNDPDDMAEKIIMLIENEELRKSMGQKARQNIKRYSAEVVMPQWEELFKRMVG